MGWIQMARMAAQAVPWTTVMQHAPEVVAAARRAYDRVRDPDAALHAAEPGATAKPVEPGVRIAELESDLQYLRAAEEKQAELIMDMARQTETLVRTIATLQARLSLALWLAGAAGILALFSFLLVLAR